MPQLIESWPHIVTIGDRKFLSNTLCQDCKFEILIADDVGICLLSVDSARLYTLTLDEAETLANELLRTVNQVKGHQSAAVPMARLSDLS
jgi:hypothetical protein